MNRVLVWSLVGALLGGGIAALIAVMTNPKYSWPFAAIGAIALKGRFVRKVELMSLFMFIERPDAHFKASAVFRD